MQICKHCRRLFDPDIAPFRFAESLLCSWHPGTAENTGNTGASGDYAELWLWSCCSKQVVGPLVDRKRAEGVSTEDYPPPRSPGCLTGPHEADDAVAIANPHLGAELAALQQRLRDLEHMETVGIQHGALFISYSHADTEFVDRLSQLLVADKVRFWRDEKDILVGDVIDRKISEGIQKNALFLVVLTPSSVASGWMSREIDEACHEASDGTKIILPVLAKGLRIAQVPSRLRRFKCADFNDSHERAYQLLRSAIRGHIERYREGAGRPTTG